MKASLILVHGGTGFIGQNLQLAFTRLGLSFAVTNSTGGLKAWCPELEFRNFTAGVEGLDEISAWSGRRFRAVIDLASPSPKALSQWCTEQIVKNAIEARIYFSEFLTRMSGINRIIYVSSGGALYNPTCSRHHKETDVICVNSKYALSKIIAESHVIERSFAKGIPYVILRPANPYGRFQRPGVGQGVVANWIDAISKHEPPVIIGDGSMVRDYICIDDVVKIIVKVIFSELEGEIINIGTGQGTSLTQLANLFEDSLGRTLNFVYRDFADYSVQRSVLNISNLLKLFPGVSIVPSSVGIPIAIRESGILS